MAKCVDCKYQGKYTNFNTGHMIYMPKLTAEANKLGFTEGDLVGKVMQCQAPGGGPTTQPIALYQALSEMPCEYFLMK